MTDFQIWMSERPRRCGFVEGVDYATETVLISPDRGMSNGRGGARSRTAIDYHLTLGAAKEVAMVENNETGREVRRYFIPS